MKAVYKRVRISPKKANLVASMVRGKKALEAMNCLHFMPKKGASVIEHVLRSAIANAENNFHQKGDSLIISQIVVNKGPVVTRHIPISRGRVHPVLKKSSHIYIELNVAEEEKKKEKKPVKKVSKNPALPPKEDIPAKKKKTVQS